MFDKLFREDSMPLDEWCKSKGFSDEDTASLKRSMNGRKVTVDLCKVLQARKNSPQFEEDIRKIQQAIANAYGLPVDMLFPREEKKFPEETQQEALNRKYNEYCKGAVQEILKELDMKKTFNFGKALELLKEGKKVCRKGWNGKGIWIEMQFPELYSRMTQAYICIVTTDLQSDNPDAPRGIVPWVASQTDMLAEDWQVKDE